jgi:hypothetical protein
MHARGQSTYHHPQTQREGGEHIDGPVNAEFEEETKGQRCTCDQRFSFLLFVFLVLRLPATTSTGLTRFRKLW